MIPEELSFWFAAAFLLGMGLSFLLYSLYLQKVIGSLDQHRRHKERDAEISAAAIVKRGEIQAELAEKSKMGEFEKKISDQRNKLEKEENRLKEREDRLDTRFSTFERRFSELEKKELDLEKTRKKLEEKSLLLQEKERLIDKEYEGLSSISKEEAEARLFKKIAFEKEEKWNDLFERKRQALLEKSEEESSKILAMTCQKIAGKAASTYAVSEILLPDPDLRGRIIGREGRNIQLFEKLTGTALIIEDRFNRVLISCYDPFRRELARVALLTLIQDGRIHPSSIETAVIQAQEQVQKSMKKRAEEAASLLGISGLHPEIKEILGATSLRTSLGQNILDHLIEVSQIMGQMAQELSLDVELAKRIGFLHDIGKAAPSEMGGPHDLVGGVFARKYGENPKVVNGIESHHGRVLATSSEAILCKSADTLSASRIGARSENSEKNSQRAELMEKIALTFPAISRAYALQAGRELHLYVDSAQIDDKACETLGTEIRQELYKNPDISKQIKLVILREHKSIEIAL